ncbi:DUF4188 domain-containing protein [Pseudonocardia sp. KRD291]|uniref:DUF4188 domain-containing protein n=1 Tax=Pseudonocardia sp. KRD291 TaxID=2792007 RepID=UPI001C4A0CD0|nr:DUF4188 domain-containing protein [Pseudonocardia sp. KRD291]MBW0104914.1 DUF4188 domain-containing protein [Pseudonocardia sp. KRD291]
MTVERTTHDKTAGEIVVFLIGMRVNKPWRVDAWAPVFAAMPRMLRELSRDPDSGMLGYRLAIGPDGPLVIQYWRDTESLYGYASDPARAHRPAWSAFFRKARTAPGAVGIWHETYTVAASESVYGDMPASGLAAALGRRVVGAGAERARQRLAS